MEPFRDPQVELIEARARIVQLEALVTELSAVVTARDASLVLSAELARARGRIIDELLERLERLQEHLGA